MCQKAQGKLSLSPERQGKEVLKLKYMLNAEIIQGDALQELQKLKAGSVHCCVTSPPYYALRDYQVSGQIGLEKTPEEYVAKMVEVFRVVRRVLRDDGTLFLNLGDSFWGGGNYRGINSENTLSEKQNSNRGARGICQELGALGKTTSWGLKPKDLIGIPWRVAFALQEDGWVLRQEIIWEKPNPMPESVRDRCTKAHEQIFMFAKSTWSGPSPRRFSHISKEDARWLALFLDTEGNICAKRAKASSGTDHFGLQICFANTSQALLERAREIIGDGTVLERPGKNSPMFYYQLSNRQAADLLYELYPHLIIKSRQADLGIHLQSLIADSDHERRTKEGRKRGRLRDDDYTEELIKIWATMKSLNHFGNPDLAWLPKPEYGHWSGCARYYYDAEAIKEPVSGTAHARGPNGSAVLNPKSSPAGSGIKSNDSFLASMAMLPDEYGRNKRSVWTVPSSPYSEAHFATFPPDLIKPCILAGTSARGCCPKCGAPWERMVDHSPMVIDRSDRTHELGQTRSSGTMVKPAETNTIGWQATCDCGEEKTIPCTVLDPFAGSGTTGMVALELGRKSILIELNPKYVDLIRSRTNVTPGLALA